MFLLGWLVNSDAGGGADCRFSTSPAAGQSATTQVWAIGDSGGFTLGQTNVQGVYSAYMAYRGTRRTDVWLVLGDNAYSAGAEDEYQTDFFDLFHSMLQQTPPWPTIGNHDTSAEAANGGFPYLDIFSTATNGEAGGVASSAAKYYSFDYANIHFICLDSMTQSRATNGAMANCLRADLTVATNQWLACFWHHPPYTKGSHDSDNLNGCDIELTEMRQNIIPILEAAGFDLVLDGHSHNYQRSHLLHGHYGNSTTLEPAMVFNKGSGRENDTGAYVKPTSGPLANQGTVYIVLGNSSCAEPFVGHHPVMFTDELSVGSVAFEVTSNRLDAVYLLSTGIVGDSFPIIKAEPGPLRIYAFTVQEGGTVVSWNSTPGQTYLLALERNDTLQATNWQAASDPVVATGATTSWTNTMSSDRAYYFRVVQLRP